MNKKILLPLLFTMSLSAQSFYDFDAKNIKGETIPMANYKGKVVLVVNVASKCGYTPQYAGLEKLNKKYKDKGLVVLGFPSNQFKKQEPGTNKEIQNFCTVNFGVTFPLFSKIDVNGDNAIPLYKYLKKEKTGFLGSESIKWNFTKFLIDRKGKVVKRYGSSTKPKEIKKDIEKLLK